MDNATLIDATLPTITAAPDTCAACTDAASEAAAFIAECASERYGFSAKQIAQLERARELGADVDTLRTLADARLVAEGSTITLPARYAGCSRHKGWARLGRGSSAIWGEYNGVGYAVDEPGTWTVYSHDGFRREQRTTWKVQHVTVGAEIWTIAD